MSYVRDIECFSLYIPRSPKTDTRLVRVQVCSLTKTGGERGGPNLELVLLTYNEPSLQVVISCGRLYVNILHT